MKGIGIDQSSMLVYEGNGYMGLGVWPTPSLIPAYMANGEDAERMTPDRFDLQRVPYIFWDESYDPISRIRKGRIYERNESQPHHWSRTRHPSHNNNVNSTGSDLCTFRAFNLFTKLNSKKLTDPCLILGTSNHYTTWSIVDAESSISGEIILYLKSRKVLGALPKINYNKINDAKNKKHIHEKLELLYNDLVSAVPDSVVDRCREAASAIGNTYLIENEFTKTALDLGQVATKLRDKAKLEIAANQASTLARFHSRSKHCEQYSRELRGITEQDAGFAVQALSLILVELGYGYW